MRCVTVETTERPPSVTTDGDGALTLSGHTGHVTCVAAADDGHILTGSQDKTVKVWRGPWPVTHLVRTIEAHTDTVRALAVLPGGGRFISGSLDGTAKLWTFGGELERTFEVGSVVFCVAALPDGVHFVVGTYNNDVRLYHVDGTLVHNFEGHGHASIVFAVAVTPDGQRVVTARSTRSCCGASRADFVSIGHFESVLAVAASSTASFLSGSVDEVNVWLLNAPTNSFGLMHAGTSRRGAARQQHALAGSRSKKVKLFNVDDGDVLRIFTHHTEQVFCLALLPDGRRLSAARWTRPRASSRSASRRRATDCVAWRHARARGRLEPAASARRSVGGGVPHEAALAP